MLRPFHVEEKGAVDIVLSTASHTIWSILPWDVPWDVGHLFFLGLTYIVLAVIGLTLTVAAVRTWKKLRDKAF